jgi:hypothetical protein
MNNNVKKIMDFGTDKYVGNQNKKNYVINMTI